MIRRLYWRCEECDRYEEVGSWDAPPASAAPAGWIHMDNPHGPAAPAGWIHMVQKDNPHGPAGSIRGSDFMVCSWACAARKAQRVFLLAKAQGDETPSTEDATMSE